MQHRPGRKWLIAGFFVALALLCLIIGYALGHNRIIERKASLVGMEADYGRVQDALVSAEAEMIDSNLRAEVAQSAADSVRAELAQLHTEVSRLEEEVAFYKSLMAPGEQQQGLKIDALEIRADEVGYRFELLLTQVALRRTYIGGDVRLDVVGREGGEQVVKSLTDLAPEITYPMKFRFRYFQDLRGHMVLPEGFEAEQVLVTAKQNGQESMQASFPWPQDADSV